MALSPGGFQNWNWGQFAKSVGIGALSGAITAGIGELFASGGALSGLKGAGEFFAQAGMHGLAQGGMSLLDGGNFWQGFASGALGSMGAAAFGMAVGKEFAKKALGQIAFGALSGAAGAVATGGEWWKGAIIGGMVAGLNHVMHDAFDNSLEGPGDEYDDPKRNPKQDKPLTKGEIDKLKKNGWSHHTKNKGKSGGQYDLYKDKKGNIYLKPKSGLGYGEPIGENIRNLTIIGAAGAAIYKIFELSATYLSRRVGPLIFMPLYIDGVTNTQPQQEYY